MRWPHYGAVLAGGSSSRMGTSKADLVLPWGETMLDQMLGTLRQICSRVVVVGGVSRPGRAIEDQRTGAGPLGGIEALLASGLDDEYLVCPTDIPLSTAPLLRRLLVETDEPASVFVDPESGWVHPLPMRISTAALPAVSRLLDRGDHAIHRALKLIGTKTIELSQGGANLLTNVNTPADLEALSRDSELPSRHRS